MKNGESFLDLDRDFSRLTAEKLGDTIVSDKEASAIVYTVHSRRAGGLSIGIDLFPDGKCCSFDCPYCELFPSKTDIKFKLAAMERGLRAAVRRAQADKRIIKDFSFSGSGEPCLSPQLNEAIVLVDCLRKELAPEAALVVITNGSSLDVPEQISFLADAIVNRGLDLWVKWDAGTEAWYRKINASKLPYQRLASGIASFSAKYPLTIQTMLCSVDSQAPSQEEASAWVESAVRLAKPGLIRRFQLYGKARAGPRDDEAQALPVSYLEERVSALIRALAKEGLAVPVALYP